MLLLLFSRFKDLLQNKIHFLKILPAVSLYPFEVSNSYTDSPLICNPNIFSSLIPVDMKKDLVLLP